MINELSQIIIMDWCRRTFGNAVAEAREERVKRLLEEVVELAQAEGLAEAVVRQSVAEVYSRARAPGQAWQEAGGVAVTFLAYCEAKGWDAKVVALSELRRILNLPAAHFRRRQNEKAAAGVGLPAEVANDGR